MINFYLNNNVIENVKVVLFDKDGTFLDDNIYWGKLAECRIKEIIRHFNLNDNLFEELCLAIGHNPNTCKLIKNGPVGVMSRNEVIEFMVNELLKYNINTDFETISEIFNKVHSEFLSNMEKYVKFIPYSEEFIRKLKQTDLKLAVVTSDTYDHTVEILKILNIDDCFEVVIGKDNCTKDKKTGEPALIALKKLNVNTDETIVIGDALMDYLMCKNANLKASILVATGQTDIEDLQKCTNLVVNNLSEVTVENAD
ncbi:MAG: HAD family hydrolase [Candidatus Gastranaerophilales bacterium]|nr:HAD family hydrolase [Candidatus Gastranaerophilales bacterium]